MPRYKEIYEKHADAYDLLVSKEDWQGNIASALRGSLPILGSDIVEFGAGTGRLTALVANDAKTVRAFDVYPNMVKVGSSKFEKLGIRNVIWGVADNRAVPVANDSADIAIAGWSFGHCTSWFPEAWREEIGLAVSEMFRIIRKNGIAVIIETLGTGKTSPNPPNEKLAEYYRMLESDFGFEKTWIRTDYRFDSHEEAKELTNTFFARSFEFENDSTGAALLPECTGIWIRRGKLVI